MKGSRTAFIDFNNYRRQCKDSIMNEFQIYISKINFDYWKNKNAYYSKTSLSPSMQASLKIIQGQGYLTSFYPKNAYEIISKIENEIEQFDFKNPDFKKLAIIFDLIQAWGGRQGRQPYIAAYKSRDKFEDWKLIYIESCKLCVGKMPEQALKKLVEIKGMGIPFATKHIRFWGKFPILDTRLSLILTGAKNFNDYNKFLSMLKELAATWNCDSTEAEKAIFAFSQHYFPNEKLTLKQMNFDEDMDILIAKKISKLKS